MQDPLCHMSHFENQPALEERFQAHWRRRVVVRFGIMGAPFQSQALTPLAGVFVLPRVNLATVDRINPLSTPENEDSPRKHGLVNVSTPQTPPAREIRIGRPKPQLATPEQKHN